MFASKYFMKNAKLYDAVCLFFSNDLTFDVL